MPFSGGQRHKSFEQSSAGTARSFAEALVPIGEHVAHLIPQIAKIVDPADDLIELIFRQRADFAAGSTARITNFENSREFFKREADFERTPDQPDALDRFRRILPVARCRSVGTRQDPDALIVTERIGAHAAFTSQFAGSHVTFPCLSVHLCAQYGPWNRFGGQALFSDIGGRRVIPEAGLFRAGRLAWRSLADRFRLREWWKLMNTNSRKTVLSARRTITESTCS